MFAKDVEVPGCWRFPEVAAPTSFSELILQHTGSGALHNLTGLHTDKKRVKYFFTLVIYVLGLVTLQRHWCDENVVSR